MWGCHLLSPQGRVMLRKTPFSLRESHSREGTVGSSRVPCHFPYSDLEVHAVPRGWQGIAAPCRTPSRSFRCDFPQLPVRILYGTPNRVALAPSAALWFEFRRGF